MDQCNAAGRLHKYLEKAIQEAGSESQHISRVWANAFSMEEVSTITLFRWLTLLMNLTFEIESKVRNIETANHELLLRNIESIRKGLSYTNLEAQWRECRKYFTDTALADLEHCADLLTRHYIENPILREELDAIGSEIDNLFLDVRDANIDRDLRLVLLELIEQLQRSVSEYEIRGASGLREAVARNLGELILRSKAYNNSNGEIKELNRFVDILKSIDKILSKAMEYRPFLDVAIPLLLGTGS